MNKLPNTTTGKAPDRPRVGPVLGAVCLGILLLAVIVSLWPRNFSPGEQLNSPAAKDIAVSQEDTMYPTSDRLRFDERPKAVYVYLRVEDLATYEDLEARVAKASKDSALGRLLGGGALDVTGEGEERLSVTYGGASGVVKFAVRPASGGRLPSGDYTVAIYATPEGSGGVKVLASKYFVIGA